MGALIEGIRQCCIPTKAAWTAANKATAHYVHSLTPVTLARRLTKPLLPRSAWPHVWASEPPRMCNAIVLIDPLLWVDNDRA